MVLWVLGETSSCVLSSRVALASVLRKQFGIWMQLATCLE